MSAPVPRAPVAVPLRGGRFDGALLLADAAAVPASLAARDAGGRGERYELRLDPTTGLHAYAARGPIREDR